MAGEFPYNPSNQKPIGVNAAAPIVRPGISNVRVGQDPRIPAWANPSPSTMPVRDSAPKLSDFLPDFSPKQSAPHSDPRVPAWAAPEQAAPAIAQEPEFKTLKDLNASPLGKIVNVPGSTNLDLRYDEARAKLPFEERNGYKLGEQAPAFDPSKYTSVAPVAESSIQSSSPPPVPAAPNPDYGVSGARRSPESSQGVPSPPAPGIMSSDNPPPSIGVIHRSPGIAPEPYSLGGQGQAGGGGSSQLGYDKMMLGIGPSMSISEQMRAQYGEALRMANRAASHPDMYPPGAALQWSHHAAQIGGALQDRELGASRIAADGRMSSKIDQLAQLSQMPEQARALFLAGSGYSPEQIQQFNQQGGQGVNPLNYASAASSPVTSDAASILNSDAPIHAKARLFAQAPGIENPNSPYRQLFNSYMARQKALDPNFERNMINQYNPYSPGHEKQYDTSGLGGLLASPFMAGEKYLWGEDPAMQAQRDQFAKDMEALGYLPRVNTPSPKVGVSGPAPQ